MDRIPHSRPTLVNGMVEAAQEAVLSEHHARGKFCRRVEETLCQRTHARHARTVSSGFAALHIALLALGTEPDDFVLVPSYVCASLLNTCAAVRAQPVLVDVDPNTCNVSEDTIRQALAREGLDEHSVRCAIVPHIFGFPAPVHSWPFGFPFVEDCAMALGAQLDGEEVGSWGKVSTFSFYATKMASSGHGGAVLTSDHTCREQIDDLLLYDNRPSWRPSFNYELSDVLAATLEPQLDALDIFLDTRRSIAGAYTDALRGLPLRQQAPHPESIPNYYRFVAFTEDPKQFRALCRDLEHADIETKPPVFRPLHRYPEVRTLDDHPHSAEDFPGAEYVQEHALSLADLPVVDRRGTRSRHPRAGGVLRIERRSGSHPIAVARRGSWDPKCRNTPPERRRFGLPWRAWAAQCTDGLATEPQNLEPTEP